MTTRPPCTKCQGTGRGDREGDEAQPMQHPILSQSKGLCERCAGSGFEPLPTRATNISQAKSGVG